VHRAWPATHRGVSVPKAVRITVDDVASHRRRHAAVRGGHAGGGREPEQRDERAEVPHAVLIPADFSLEGAPFACVSSLNQNG